MPVKWKMEGVKRNVDLLAGMSKQARAEGNPRLEVGYTASYATRVHEDLQMYHTNGQAKFLERPMRELGGQMNSIVRNAVRRGRTLRQAMFLAGEFLMAASKKLVPVRTGFLRASGYVRVV